MPSHVVAFPGAEHASVNEVGGKAYSLIQLSNAGLAVPPGVVLTGEFFTPWFEQLQTSPSWQTFLTTPPDEWPQVCETLQREAVEVALTAEQEQALADVRQWLAGLGHGTFAVRSSSPEEDMDSASFAGEYHTELGVKLSKLEEAVRKCFASCLSERVFIYKQQHVLDVTSPSIAVVIQQQIDSEAAGVGFSLNPLTNDYDQAVIDANWGLGESVVSGAASPDHFVVNKSTKEVVEKTVGAKQASSWLRDGGGTVDRAGYRCGDVTLTDAQLAKLTDAISQIEELFDKPIDIEWAYAGGKLYILQARPITTYVPLPPEMLTKLGQRRMLYADAALSKGLTTNAPISQMGLSWIDEMYAEFLPRLLGMRDFTPQGGLVFTAGSRFYLNVSNYMWLGVSAEAMSKGAAATDTLLAEILGSVDTRAYRAAKRPPWVGWRLLLVPPKLLWLGRRFLCNVIACFLAPERARRSLQQEIESFETDFVSSVDFEQPLTEFARTHTFRVFNEMFSVTMPALLAGLASPHLVLPKRAEDLHILADALRRGFPDNLVIEQGIALFELAQMLEPADFDDLKLLAQQIERRELPTEFMSNWDAFMRRFGCRGPREMDVASQRYADDLSLALEQMSFMAGESAFDPRVAHQRNVDERHQAYEELLNRLGWFRRGLLRRVYRLIEAFGGLRDTPKYHAVMLTHAIHKRALIEGERLVAAGRLDDAHDIFDLKFADVDEAIRNEGLDLRAVREERTRFAQRLAAHVTEFPQVIDSRGRILRPPARATQLGELIGMPVSPGTVAGKVKVLRNPREKPIEQGDILVAYTTDPGWTPLFVNAAAVLLEVGGMLQHGAVVAREYSKPCVVGIDQLMTKLHDGQHVEVDGAAGIVRVLDGDRE